MSVSRFAIVLVALLLAFTSSSNVDAGAPKLDSQIRLFEQGRFTDAEKGLADLIAKSPQAMGARLLMGWVLWSQGRYDEALIRFKSVLHEAAVQRMPTSEERLALGLPTDMLYIENPDRAQARKGLGWTYFKKGWILLAHEQFLDLNRQFPGWDEPYLGLGYTFLALGKPRDSELSFLTYLAKTGAGTHKPEEGERGLASLEVARGHLASAIAHGERALTLKPGWTEIESDLAWIYIRANEPARAERLFMAMRKARPQEAEVGLAWVALKLNRLDAADEAFSRILATTPAYAPALDGLRLLRKPLDDAWALYDSSKYREALSAFAALAKNPGRQPAAMRPLATTGLAWAHLAVGEVGEAERLFRGARADPATRADATAGLGWVGIKRKQWSEAEKALADAGRAQPALRSVTNGLALLRSARFGDYDAAWSAYRGERYSEALKAFEAILDRPADLPHEFLPLVRAGIGWCRLGLGRIDQAQASFEQIKPKRPEDTAEVKSGFGWVALKRNHLDEARRLFEEASRALAGHPAVVRGLAEMRKAAAPGLDEAWALLRQGKVEEAASRFHEIADSAALRDEYRREARRGSAWSLYGKGAFQDALAGFEALLKNGEDADLVYGRGLALLRLPRYGPAAASLKRAIDLAPGVVDYQLAYGWALLRSGDVAGALRVFVAASRVAPGSGEVARSLGWAYVKANRPEEATTAFRDAVTMIPGATDDGEFRTLVASGEYRELRRDLAWGYVRWHGFEAARALFEELTKVDAGDGDAWFGEGYALYKLGRTGEADISLERAIRAKRPTGTHIVWVVFPDAGSYPIYADPYSILGWTALVEGHCDLALARFEASLDRDPEMVASMVGKGTCLAKAGRIAEARQVYEVARQIYPTYPAVVAGLAATEPGKRAR